MGVSRADNSVKIWQIFCPLAIPNQISYMSMHIASLVKKSLVIYSSYRPEMKIWLCLGHITP